MLGFLRRIFFLVFDRIPLFRRRGGEAEIPEEFWEAGFSKPNRTRFDIKSENTYDAYLQNGGLGIGLKKTRRLAWVEGTFPYRDMVLKARLRLDSRGGYGAAGIIFRMIDGGTCYMVLLSSKGYFRLDTVRNSMPLALIGWTEFEGPAPSPHSGAELTVIAFGPRITLVINGVWAGEISDTSIEAGFLGFVLASYQAGQAADGAAVGARDTTAWDIAAKTAQNTTAGAGQTGLDLPPAQTGAYAAEAFLDYLSVDTRIAEVGAAWRFWNEGQTGTDLSPDPGAARPGPARLRLAETFAAMGESATALEQIKKLWAEEVRREPWTLLLAARLAQILELYDEAEEYIDACLTGDSPGEGAGKDGPGIIREAAVEKAKILYARGRYDELGEYAGESLAAGNSNAALAALLGHARWESGNYGEAALAYDRAFELDGENGLHAANAANMYEALGRKTEALDRSLAAGRAFLRAGNYQDLGILIPKLLNLGPEHWEAHALAGKWAFGIENWDEAAREFDRTAALGRKAKIKAGEKDPALSYLRALLLIRGGKRREALPLLEEAVRLAPDYGLFRFRLAENRFLLNNNPADPRLRADLEKALSLLDPAVTGEKSALVRDRPAVEGETANSGEIGRGGGSGSGAAGNEEEEQTWGWVNNLAAQISLAGGDLEAAGKFLEKAAAALGETPPVLANRAVYEYLRGSLDRALNILDLDRELDAEGLMANCAGNLLVRAGQFDKADLRYQKALTIAPDNPEFLVNRASCLVELGAYGEADALLARAWDTVRSPAVLELIAYVAVKKGEYPRAEAACNAALEMDGDHPPSLHSLGWIYGSTGRWEEAGEILARLDSLPLSGEDAERREELRQRILDGTTRLIPCARCGRTWRVPLDPPPAPFLRLVAMPPDELPAGTCPSCGTSYCIGCAKEHVDAADRFTCPACGKPLKLIHEGLKKIVADWAAKALPGRENAPL
ncbi:MAG: tetratricopeptide repeat protein [Treponema sp.]|jgi:tetratricopeptide (TPR) repeat protein|nr:tetratricopeptide repeat protein [Treponema sp.]